ncbi:hypothetical protein ACEQ8H_008700 [Pleosporales sp. CAS-2024a]
MTANDDTTAANDVEKQANAPRIIWHHVDHRERGRSEAKGTRRLSRSRSQSCDSISSVRSRAQSVSGIPIGFRTLSIQISESQAKASGPPLKDSKRTHGENKDYFGRLEYHTLSTKDVCDRFNVFPEQGLTNEAAGTRLQRDGKNDIPSPPQHFWTKLFGYVFGGFCSILWVGVIIFFICWRPLGDPNPAAYNLGLAILVMIVILLQACFSAFQDWSTKRTMKSILDLLPSDALVLRGGSFVKVPSADVVAGDIVRISIGNKVPADMRLLSTSGDIRFDRSMITGEPDEVEGAVDSTDQNFLESRNICFMGTMVVNGSATGIVVLTGKNSIMGRIAQATSAVEDQPTLIQREISRFVHIIVGLTALLALLLLFTWAGWLRVHHKGFLSVIAMLNNVMGCVVAFIPEGMPVGVALTLMMVARRMKSASVLPKGLSTVETLGCVNVICSDKTGTLTENKMTVTSIGFVDELKPADELAPKLSSEECPEPLEELHRAAILCNDAMFDPTTIHLPVKERGIQGNATDGAVLRFAEEARVGKAAQDAYPRVFAIPFNSKNKWMLSMHNENGSMETVDGQEHLVLVKGAPDVLLPKCSSWLSFHSNKVETLDVQAQRLLSQAQEKLSRNAERVIMLCQRRYRPTASLRSNAFADEITEHALKDLTIIGMLGILDPPRPESAETVATCRRAGIRFFMVTGDFGLTGAAIARRIGIFSGEQDPDTIDNILNQNSTTEKALTDKNPSESSTRKSLLLEGSQLNNLTDSDWEAVCAYEEIVFGRTTPEQKLRIVNELKQRQNVVAVTGDGVNDAPALRASDVGIAIVSGSDVALEASDLVLLDKFSSIVDGIRLGRLVFQNLQKVIGYLLPAGSWSEIWPVILNVFFGVPLPLSSFLMIIICVFTDLFCALALVMEREEFDLLSLPPRNTKRDHLINLKIYIQSYLFIGVAETLCAHAMFFLYMWRHARIPLSALFFAYEKYEDGFYGYTEEQLTYFNTVGQCVYFVTLVILQWGNILSIRNKRLSILQADPFRKERRNPYLALSILISFCIAVFVTEVKGIQNLFGTASVPIEFWLIPIPLALGILVMDEMRKLAVRTWPKGPIARMAW